MQFVFDAVANIFDDVVNIFDSVVNIHDDVKNKIDNEQFKFSLHLLPITPAYKWKHSHRSF